MKRWQRDLETASHLARKGQVGSRRAYTPPRHRGPISCGGLDLQGVEVDTTVFGVPVSPEILPEAPGEPVESLEGATPADDTPRPRSLAQTASLARLLTLFEELEVGLSEARGIIIELGLAEFGEGQQGTDQDM